MGKVIQAAEMALSTLVQGAMRWRMKRPQEPVEVPNFCVYSDPSNGITRFLYDKNEQTDGKEILTGENNATPKPKPME